MMFNVEIEKQALHFLKKLKDKRLKKRISDKIDRLQENPFPREAKMIDDQSQSI